MATLSLSGVRKSFGALEVLSSVDLALEDGGFLVLLGPSGCGKSTLLSIIAGLEPASGGDVMIGERRVNDVHPTIRAIAASRDPAAAPWWPRRAAGSRRLPGR